MFDNIQEAYKKQLELRKQKESRVVATFDDSPTIVNKVGTYDYAKREDIVQSLNMHGYNKVVQPSEIELDYVSSVFISKGFTDISTVKIDMITAIGKSEMEELNNHLKKFTSSISGTDSSVLFYIIDNLSKETDKSDLPIIYQKALSVKPSLMARLFSVFDDSSEQRSISDKLKLFSEQVKLKCGNLESKLAKIEQDLNKEKEAQEKSMKMLQSTFDAYYNSFMKLRKQFALVVYIEHSYSKQLERYKLEHQNTEDLTISKSLQDYDRTYKEIVNKRLLLHKTMLQLKVTSDNYNQLYSINSSIIREIENTIISSMPNIRSNILGIHSALIAQKGMLAIEKANHLNNNSSALQNEMLKDLAVKSERLVGQQRLNESNMVLQVLEDIKERNNLIRVAKEQCREDLETSTRLLIEATEKVRESINTP